MEDGSVACNGGGKGYIETEDGKTSEAALRSMLGLQEKWSVWEQWQPIGDSKRTQRDDDYMRNMQRLAEFDNLIDFCRVWNYIPHSDPAAYFASAEAVGQQPTQKQ